MKEKLKMGFAVFFIAVVAWLFAEAESLGEQSMWAQVRVIAPDEMTMVETLDGWEGGVNVQLRGPQAALNMVKSRLAQVIEVTPGISNALPGTEGRQVVRLIDLLGGVEEIADSGVTIVSTSPISVSYRVTRLVDVSLPIEVSLEGVQVEGEVTTTPATASVRLPSALQVSAAEGASVIGQVDADALASLPDGGAVEIGVTLGLPESLAGERYVRLLTQRATVSFSVRSTLARESQTVPVQILLPSVEQDRWRVRLASGDEVLRVRLVGPSEAVRRITSGEARLVGVLALSSDDLAGGVTEKRVSFSVVREGVLGPVEGGLRVELEDGDAVVGFRAERIAEQAAGDE